MASLKRSSSNAGNKANHPNKRIQIKPHEPSKRYVYVVVQDWQADSYAKIVTKYKGSYASLVDANNRVLQLWYHPEDTEAGPEYRQESAIEGKHADGEFYPCNCLSATAILRYSLHFARGFDADRSRRNSLVEGQRRTV